MFFIGVDLKKVDECMGDPQADEENPVLKEEQEAQVFEDRLILVISVFFIWF